MGSGDRGGDAYTERQSPRNACLTGGLGTFSRAGIPIHHRSHDPYAWTPGPSSPVDGATSTSYDSSIGDQSSQAMGPSASQGATAPPLRVSIFSARVQSNTKETQLNCSQQSLPRFPALFWKKTAGLIHYHRCLPPPGRTASLSTSALYSPNQTLVLPFPFVFPVFCSTVYFSFFYISMDKAFWSATIWFK